MRGSLTFKTLFDIPMAPAKGASGKGRDAELIGKRNELLLTRYWWLGTFSSKRYDIIIGQLSDELFLSERRVTDIIQANHQELMKMRKEPPTVPELKRKWPHMNWSI